MEKESYRVAAETDNCDHRLTKSLYCKQKTDVFQRFLFVCLSTIYIVFSVREMYITRYEIHSLKSLVHDLQTQQGNEVNSNEVSRKHEKSDLKSKTRQKRSSLPSHLLPLDTGSHGHWTLDTWDNFRRSGHLSPNVRRYSPRTRPSPASSAQVGMLYSSVLQQRNDPSTATPSANSSSPRHPLIRNRGSSTRRIDRPNVGNVNNGSPRLETASTFIRWGKPSCPQTSRNIYSGYAAGAYPIAGFGGSTELECLPSNPAWSANASSAPLAKTLLTAAKFSLGDHTGVFPAEADNSVVPCAVCISSKATTLMIPGWIRCPYAWRREYYGYLMSTPSIPSQYYFSSKNYCVDRNPDFYLGHSDSYGLRLTFVQAGHCYRDSNPCNNYQMRNRLSCTVCSKLTETEVNSGVG